MSPPPDVPKGTVRQGIATVVAALGAVAAILAAYYLMPVPDKDDSPLLLFVLIALVTTVYCAGAVWALMRIQRSKRPMRMGVMVLAVMFTAAVVVFALAYLDLSVENPASFNVPLDKVSALYFTMTILTTVGFGDIHAATHPAMIAVMLQMVVGLTLITTLARVVVEATRRAARHRGQQLRE